MNLQHIHRSLTQAADAAREKAQHYQALATVVHAMHNPAHPDPTPILQLAHALRELDLCLVHRHALMQAIDIVRETEDADGLSADELDHLLTRLDRSLHPEEET